MNYSSEDLCILRYERGSYAVVQAPTGLSGMAAGIEANKAERICLTAIARLEGMGLQPTESGSSPHYLPRLIMQHQLSEGLGQHDFARAMRRLMTDGKLRRAEIGKYPNRSPKYGLVVSG